MSFDETYLKCFDIVYQFCFARNGGNQYMAEEATKKTMDFMAQKWEMIQSYDSKMFYAWLYGVARRKILETKREQKQKCDSLDAPWYQNLVEQQQIKHGEPLDEETEYQRFLEYSEQIEKKLRPIDRELFHYRVVDGLLHREIAQRMNISENAVKMRWIKLKGKIKPIVNKLLNRK